MDAPIIIKITNPTVANRALVLELLDKLGAGAVVVARNNNPFPELDRLSEVLLTRSILAELADEIGEERDQVAGAISFLTWATLFANGSFPREYCENELAHLDRNAIPSEVCALTLHHGPPQVLNGRTCSWSIYDQVFQADEFIAALEQEHVRTGLKTLMARRAHNYRYERGAKPETESLYERIWLLLAERLKAKYHREKFLT